MTEKEILISHTRELKIKAEENSMITATNFLSPEQLSDIVFLEKQNNKYINTFYYGGYSDAQRVVAVFVPDFFAVEDINDYLIHNEDDNPICMLKLKKDRFSSLSHRDYLGAVMGLGIEREMIGDIISCEDGAYMFCVRKIAKYICDNLIKAGKGTIECEKCNIDELTLSTEDTEDFFTSVASLRLDNIVSAAFNLSRSSAVQHIKQGIVYINNSQCQKPDFNIVSGDKIVLRGKGKRVLKEVKGETRKGRIHIIIKKYN